MSLWHLSPPLSARVNSSDLFTFTLVFQRTELETAEDWFVMEFVIAGSLLLSPFLDFNNTLPFNMHFFLLFIEAIFLKNQQQPQSLSINTTPAEEILLQFLFKTTTMFCIVILVFGHSTVYLCYFSSCRIYGCLSVNLIAATFCLFF